jgi:hypothetical protein
MDRQIAFTLTSAEESEGYVLLVSPEKPKVEKVKVPKETHTKPCDKCGKIIPYFPSNPQKYCSQSCYAAAQRTPPVPA